MVSIVFNRSFYNIQIHNILAHQRVLLLYYNDGSRRSCVDVRREPAPSSLSQHNSIVQSCCGNERASSSELVVLSDGA